MCYCPTPTLHLNLALTGDGAFLFSLKKTYSVWFISILNYGDTENVLINHLLLVIPVSYLCHYTNLCPHKPHKHAHTHTHTHTHTHLQKYWNSKDRIALLAVESVELQNVTFYYWVIQHIDVLPAKKFSTFRVHPPIWCEVLEQLPHRFF